MHCASAVFPRIKNHKVVLDDLDRWMMYRIPA